jgi:hypothetical protein
MAPRSGRAVTPERLCQLAVELVNPPGQFIPISRAGNSRSNSGFEAPSSPTEDTVSALGATGRDQLVDKRLGEPRLISLGWPASVDDEEPVHLGR